MTHIAMLRLIQIVRNQTRAGGLMNNSGYAALTDDWAWLRCIWPIFYPHKHAVTSYKTCYDDTFMGFLPSPFACHCIFCKPLCTCTLFHTAYSAHQSPHISSKYTWMKDICICLLMILSDNCCVLMNNSCHQLMIQIPHLSSPLAPSWQ